MSKAPEMKVVEYHIEILRLKSRVQRLEKALEKSRGLIDLLTIYKEVNVSRSAKDLLIEIDNVMREEVGR